MKREIENSYPGGDCFFCGPENAAGLQLRFFLDEETGEVSTEYRPSRTFAGMGDLLHGGIQMGMLDEIMGWATHHLTGEMGVTTGIDATFHRPVYLERPLVVACTITARVGSRVELEARIETGRGEVCTSAVGTYRLLPRERFDAIVNES